VTNEILKPSPRFPLHLKILAGLLIGGAAGLVSNRLWAGSQDLDRVLTLVAQPVGQVFLRMLFMIVIPLVITSLALGVAGLGDLGRLGRVGIRTLGLFLATTTIAVLLGLTIANLVRPGDAIDEGARREILAEFADEADARIEEGSRFGVETLVAIVPRNPVDAAARGDMLGVIFFTLVFGVALTRIRPELAAPVIRGLEGVGAAVTDTIGLAMKLAPIGVAALIFVVTARFGFDLLRSLGLYVGMVLGGLALHQIVVIPALARIFGGVRPPEFFRRSRTLILTAFSTSSSSATLPTTIRTAEENFGVPREIAGFVLPLGATLNMNGTALFEGMTVLFLAQVFGVELSLGTQAVVVLMTVLTAIGTAGVPGGSIPLLAMVLTMVGVPAEGIAIILGVDRLLDMARTVPNVTGDLCTSLIVARMERRETVPAEPPDVTVPGTTIRPVREAS
jgi:DAACS family dicarboxylate/amino acid:cation (Na+ or H+) symporter